MVAWSPSRRRLLQTGAALGTAAFAGCTDALPGSDSSGNTSDALGVVPADATFVGYADVDALLADDALRTRLNDFLEAAGEAGATVPTTVEGALDTASGMTGLDPRKPSSLVAFGSVESSLTAGVVVWSDWTTDDVRSALSKNGASVDSATYGEADLILGEGVAVGTLDEGTFAVGDRATVEAVVDVVAGDAPPVDGRARQGFEATSEGAIRFAVAAPDDLGEGSSPPDPTVDPEAVASITHVYGSYAVDGGDRRSSITVETDAADAAETLRTGILEARDEALSDLEELPEDRPMVDEVASLLESLEVTADGPSVVVATDDGALMPVIGLAAITSFAIGLETGSSTATSPQVAFEFEYEAESGRLTITHHGGDSVRASALSIRGENHATGTWAELGGDASGEFAGEPAVVAGDAVTIDADPDYVAQIVWESQDERGGVAATLAMDQGPEA
jgi:hypothetical protein